MRRQILTVGLSEEMNGWFRECYALRGIEVHLCANIEAAKQNIVKQQSYLLAINAEKWSTAKILDTVRGIRQISFIPILVLTNVNDFVPILDSGADFCLPYNIDYEAFLAFSKALVRRYSLYDCEQRQEHLEPELSRGQLKIDQVNCRVTLAGEKIHLPSHEYDLLLYFAKNPGKVISAEKICETVWGTYHRDVTPVIASLRQKLKDDKSNPIYIETVHKAGYRFLVSE